MLLLQNMKLQSQTLYQLTSPTICIIIMKDSFIKKCETKVVRMINIEAEVVRLEELKASKMKELVLRKKAELEELCRRTHLVERGDNEVEISIEVIEFVNFF
ncbi:hypothetical protein IEQ34_018571 [Dendrobium chrysotoxum]|uniref:Uncharacterized protein n=1 Tax=Dendrobium chrysotoxum TaxID=161865 RepID=A0AAV7G4Z3_DENCH|nr:hypothetical protein IEQ34_018571 [Dendrobium chrysotoxum]